MMCAICGEETLALWTCDICGKQVCTWCSYTCSECRRLICEDCTYTLHRGETTRLCPDCYRHKRHEEAREVEE